MASTQTAEQLLRSSIVVTGTHYSMTTLAGRLLSAAPEYHLLHEPTNARPTLSYDSIAPQRWYEYYTRVELPQLKAFLQHAITADMLSQQIIGRARQVRSPNEVMQVLRYLQRKVPIKLRPRPAILKDPFLLFSSRTLQRELGLRVVITVRHPCAFAESFLRADNPFDFANLTQPALLEAMPHEADAITRAAATPPPPIEQASLLWRIAYGFAASYLTKNTRTHTIRQDDLVLRTDDTVAKLLAFAGVEKGPEINQFLEENLTSNGSDFQQSGSYIRRDARATLDKWRDRLSQDQVAQIRTATAHVAEHFGYGGH